MCKVIPKTHLYTKLILFCCFMLKIQSSFINPQFRKEMIPKLFPGGVIHFSASESYFFFVYESQNTASWKILSIKI